MRLPPLQRGKSLRRSVALHDPRRRVGKVAPDGNQGIIRWGGMKEYGSNHQILTPIFVGMNKDGEQVIIGRMY